MREALGSALLLLEIQPSDFFKFKADMNCALSKIAPIDATVPRRLGMRQFFTEETEWKALAGETFADYSDYDSAAGRPAMKAWPCYALKLEHFCDRCASVTLDWDYDARTVKCSMPGHVNNATL